MNGMKMLRPILLAGLVLPGTAFAQSAAADNRPNDIIVTATKREQTLLDVPLSVAVVGGDKMESMGITKFDDFQSSVPISLRVACGASELAQRMLPSTARTTASQKGK